MPDVSASRILIARRCAGLTGAALAAAIGVTPAAITQYEAGARSPTDENLRRLALATGFLPSFFESSDLPVLSNGSAHRLPEPPVLVSFRAKQSMTAGERDAAMGWGSLAVGLAHPWLEQRFSLPTVDLPDLIGNDPGSAADVVRGVWGLSSGPVGSVVQLLEAKGVSVFWFDGACDKMDALSFWSGDAPFVMLNRNATAGDRVRFSIAHELGHLVMHRGAERNEAQAHEFASAFLLPKRWCEQHLPESAVLTRYLALKRVTKVSVAAMLVRAHRLQRLSDWQYKTAMVELGRRGWRTSEPESPEPEQSYIHNAVFQCLAESGVAPEQVAGELGLHVHQLVVIMPGADVYLRKQPEDAHLGPRRAHLREV